jgi:hypothetical protein
MQATGFRASMLNSSLLIFVLCTAVGCLAQTDSGVQPPASAPASTVSEPSQANDASDAAQPTNTEAMTIPAVVGGMGSSLAFTSETERSNYLRGGVSGTVAYQDNVFAEVGNVGSDVSYTLGPFITLDLTRPRYRLDFTYSPGFTFYQRHTSLDQTSQALGLNFSLRLSPHVTFTAQDSFVKTSAFLGPLAFNGIDTLPNPLQSPNLTLIAPVADTLINTANVGISYQFGLNDMVGATGNYSILNYLNRSQVPGLFDSTGEGGGAYYNHRFQNRNYIGVNYQFQRFVTDLGSLQLGNSQLETRTNSIYGTYTLYIKPTFSITAFGGPQYSDTFGGALVPQKMWSPSEGGSLAWRGQETSFAASFSRRITDGGGLPGAVRANIADASVRAQFTKTLIGSASADYATNAVLDSAALSGFEGGLNGHSVSESVSLVRTFGEHWSGSIAYLHLHQSYANISTFDVAPNQNRASISISYHFERPLGR